MTPPLFAKHRPHPLSAAAWCSLVLCSLAWAQPAPGPSPKSAPPSATPSGHATATPQRIPVGAMRADPAPSGPGHHSPLSRFPQLKDREGVVSWSVLSAVTTRIENNAMRPVFSKPAQALDEKIVILQGFMMPLQPGRTQGRFLLSAVPTTCQFCTPAGAEGLVDIRSADKIPFIEDAILLRGRLELLRDEKSGLYYRLLDAKLVK